jgi:uncharacterized protein (TIGR03435 family)
VIRLWSVLTLAVAIGGAQDTFDVASVRPTPPDASLRSVTAQLPQCIAGTMQVDPNRFTATNATLYALITWAYGIRYSCFIANDADLLSGGPAWVLTERFDIQAKLPEGAPRYTRQDLIDGKAPELQSMLRKMLAERFNLRVRRSTKDMRVFTLTPAPAGMKTDASRKDDPQRSRLGLELTQGQELIVRINGNKASMEDFAHLIEAVTHTPVLDRTGFKGDFSFDAKFAVIDPGRQTIAERIAQIGALGQYPEALSPTVFAVLEQQFGIKLEGGRAPVESWIIERAEKPSEN